MGLLDEICERRSRLYHTTTIVTTPGGKVFKEKSCTDGFWVCEQLNKQSSQCPGFVIDLKPDLEVAEVVPGLCFGSQDVTQEVDILQKHHITHIISLGVDVSHLDSSNVEYHFVPFLDLPETDVVCVFDKVLPLIHNLLSHKKVVFVHCNAGVSRSPTIIIAYLMKFKGVHFQNAFEHVRTKRPSIKPNPGFIEQLRKLDTSCEFT